MTTEQKPDGARLSMESLRGILLPCTTPFDTSGEVDRRALATNIEKWNETGIKGYVVLGSSGERVHLNERECLAVIEAARERVPRDFSFIVGAGQQSVRATVEEVRQCARAGADAVLVITPNYYRAEMTPLALADYYQRVADASPVPVLLYSVPQLTNITLAPETVSLLGEHENIIGIKDSSGDILNLGEILRLAPASFMTLTGHGAALLAALGAGAQGAILGVGLFAPRACVEIYRAAQAADYERARDLQRRVALLVRVVMGRFGIGGIKAACEALGYAGGRVVRAPLRAPDEAARMEINKALKESGLFDEEIGSAVENQKLGAGAT